MMTHTRNNVVLAIWDSFAGFPVWVRLWMVLWLIPMNAASVLFVNEAMGIWVAALATLGMLLNVPIMILERRLSRAMALPHLVFWTPLVGLIIWMAPDINSSYGTYLIALAATNVVSLMFDGIDAYRWFKGDRG